MDVSVIVPVFNPGPFIEQCIESLLTQTLPSDAYEVIFVDDGSTDETPQRLAELAAAHDNVIVKFEPNSGWSGRPRNVGLGVARGEFVFFCDHDDWLSPEALERMVHYARESSADVLAPKIIGHQRDAPTMVFERNVPDASFESTPLMFGLAPHKLFRRAFLERHGIRFREGRRFEDQVFVLQAYLQAQRVAVLADYECYHHVRRLDGANAAFLPAEPEDYVAKVAEVIDVIEALTEPGPLRELVLRRPFQTELTGRFARRWFVATAEDYQRDLLVAVSRLVNERFPADFDDQFGPVIRARAAAVRAADFDTARALGESAARLQARAQLSEFQWDGEAWQAQLEAEIVFDDGSPFRLTPTGGDTWQVDARLLVPGVDIRPERTAELLAARAVVEIVGQDSGVNWFVPSEMTAQLQPVDGDGQVHRLLFAGSARFDPSKLAGNRQLPVDTWRVRVRIVALGHPAVARLRGEPGLVGTPASAIVGSPAVVVTPVANATSGNLIFRVWPVTRALLAALLRRSVTAVRIEDGALQIDVRVKVAASVEGLPVRLQLRSTNHPPAHLDAVLVPTQAGGVLRAGMSPVTSRGSGPAPGGRFRLVVRSGRPVNLGAHVVVSAAGVITSAGLKPPATVVQPRRGRRRSSWRRRVSTASRRLLRRR